MPGSSVLALPTCYVASISVEQPFGVQKNAQGVDKLMPLVSLGFESSLHEKGCMVRGECGWQG